MDLFPAGADGSTTLRVPPQDLLAEQSVLGCVLLEPAAAEAVLPMLVDADFYREAHRTLYRAMQAPWKRNEPVDLITVAAELRQAGVLDDVGGPEYLTALIGEVVTTAHVRRYAAIVREKSLLRRLVALGMELAAAAYDQADEVRALMEQAETKLMGLMGETLASGRAVHVSDMCDDEPAEQILEMARQDAAPTERPVFGLKELDDYLGGVHIPSLVTIMGFTGFGKSSLMAMLADTWAVERGQPTAWYTTGEETRVESIRRIVGIRRDLDLSPLGVRFYQDRYGDRWLEDELRIGTTEVLTGNLFVNERVLDFDEWAQDVRELRRQHGVRLVLLDYLERLDPETRDWGNKVERMERMAKRTQKLQSELDLCVVTGSQVSEDLNGEMRARYCGALENNGHLNLRVAGEFGGTQEEQRARNRYHMVVRKNRFGPSGSKFLMERRFGYFRQASADSHEATQEPAGRKGQGVDGDKRYS